MINAPTLLVLGAGASIPFGFPSGLELLSLICQKLGSTSGRELFLRLGFGVKELDKFRDALLFSGKTSVDGFLEYRIEFIEIGKIAIAAELIPRESEVRLFHRDHKYRNWYVYLFEKMSCSFDEFHSNKLSVITYNYDRSLEHFLLTSVMNSFAQTWEESTEKLKRIAIVHLHGRLGFLPWQKDTGRRYVGQFSDSDLYGAANNIKIISEQKDIVNDDDFQQAHKLLEEAEVVYFLGFGYNEINVERLRIDSYPEGKLFGTCYGLGEAERQQIMTHWPNVKLAGASLDVLDFFRHYKTLR